MKKIVFLPLLVLLAACSSTKKMSNPDLISVRENNSKVNQFVKYVNDNNHLVPDHAYIKNALNMLADATTAIAGEVSYTVKGNLNEAKRYADDLTVNPNETTHADDIRKAADILTLELQGLQQQKYPSLGSVVSALMKQAASINPNRLTDAQKQEIGGYLRQSADLLDKMN